MLNLSATFKYYICTDEVTLRYRHRGLRDYIKSKLHKDPTNGDVYIFLSRDFKRMRVYYHNHGGAILTEKILQNSRFVTPVFEDADKHVYHISCSIRESLTSAIRAEFDMQKQELIASFNREKQEMLDSR